MGSTTEDFRVTVTRRPTTKEIKGIVRIRSDHYTPKPKQEHKRSGFLLTALTEKVLREIPNKHNGTFYFVKDSSDKVCAYAIVTPMKLFMDYFEDPEKSRLKLKVPVKTLTKSRYVAQIAVSKKQQGKHLGRLILDALKRRSKGPITADTIERPLPNTRSANFFAKNGFKKVGRAVIASYRDSGKIETIVHFFRS